MFSYIVRKYKNLLENRRNYDKLILLSRMREVCLNGFWIIDVIFEIKKRLN